MLCSFGNNKETKNRYEQRVGARSALNSSHPKRAFQVLDFEEGTREYFTHKLRNYRRVLVSGVVMKD